MKNNRRELDVDFIGGQDPMTKEEELAVSAFIKAYEDKASQPRVRKATAKTRRIVKQAA